MTKLLKSPYRFQDQQPPPSKDIKQLDPQANIKTNKQSHSNIPQFNKHSNNEKSNNNQTYNQLKQIVRFFASIEPFLVILSLASQIDVQIIQDPYNINEYLLSLSYQKIKNENAQIVNGCKNEQKLTNPAIKETQIIFNHLYLNTEYQSSQQKYPMFGNRSFLTKAITFLLFKQSPHIIIKLNYLSLLIKSKLQQVFQVFKSENIHFRIINQNYLSCHINSPIDLNIETLSQSQKRFIKISSNLLQEIGFIPLSNYCRLKLNNLDRLKYSHKPDSEIEDNCRDQIDSVNKFIEEISPKITHLNCFIQIVFNIETFIIFQTQLKEQIIQILQHSLDQEYRQYLFIQPLTKKKVQSLINNIDLSQNLKFLNQFERELASLQQSQEINTQTWKLDFDIYNFSIKKPQLQYKKPQLYYKKPQFQYKNLPTRQNAQSISFVAQNFDQADMSQKKSKILQGRPSLKWFNNINDILMQDVLLPFAEQQQLNQFVDHIINNRNIYLQYEQLKQSNKQIDNLNKYMPASDPPQLNQTEDFLKFIRLNQYYFQLYPDTYELAHPNIKSILNRAFQQLKLPSIKTAITRAINMKKQKNNYNPINQQNKQQKQLATKELIQKQFLKYGEQLDQKQKRYHLLNRIISSISQKQKQKILNQTSILIKIQQQGIQTPIQTYISQSTIFYIATSGYQDIINKIKHKYNLISPHKNLQYDNSTAFLNQIQYQRIPSMECLKCSQFLFYNQNIRDDTVNKVPIITVSNTKTFENLKKDLVESICALLNSNGGIILLNCDKKYLEVFPIGIEITQTEKKEEIEDIQKLLNQIQPKPIMNQHIFVDHVPLIHSFSTTKREELKYSTKKHTNYQNKTIIRPFMEGIFVPRIKVAPNYQKFYYSVKQPIQNQIFQLRQYQKCRVTPQNERRFKQDKKNEKVSIYLKDTINNFDHTCKSPDIGLPIQTHFQRNHLRGIRINLQQSFDSMSMMICKKKYLNTIRNKFYALGLHCEIQQKFESYKFKSAMYTAILYHNISYHQLQQKVSFNPQFQFQSKMLLILNITDYLRLQNRSENNMLTLNQYKNIREWLLKEFPRETLRIWMFQNPKNKKKQIYAQTESKSSTLFLYYILNNYLEKTCLKNPAGLDNIDLPVRNINWKEITFEYKQSQYIQGRQLIRMRNLLKSQNNRIEQYLLDKMVLCFKRYKQTYRIIKQQKVLLIYFQLLSNKRLIQFRSTLIQQEKLKFQSADDIIQKIIELPQICKQYGKQCLGKLLIEKTNTIFMLYRKLKDKGKELQSILLERPIQLDQKAFVKTLADYFNQFGERGTRYQPITRMINQFYCKFIKNSIPRQSNSFQDDEITQSQINDIILQNNLKYIHDYNTKISAEQKIKVDLYQLSYIQLQKNNTKKKSKKQNKTFKNQIEDRQNSNQISPTKNSLQNLDNQSSLQLQSSESD